MMEMLGLAMLCIAAACILFTGAMRAFEFFSEKVVFPALDRRLAAKRAELARKMQLLESRQRELSRARRRSRFDADDLADLEGEVAKERRLTERLARDFGLRLDVPASERWDAIERLRDRHARDEDGPA